MKTERLSDRVAGQLERRIVEGVYLAGDLLPPERTLASEMEVSRPTVREALNKLAVKGLLETRQGGGHRVCRQLGSTFTDPLMRLLGEMEDFQYDILEFRHGLEGMAAWYAAERATCQDQDRIRHCLERLEQAHEQGDSGLQASADAAFHQAIADASHNVLIQHTLSALFTLLSESIRESVFQFARQAQVEAELLRQHRALAEAILSGDAPGAQAQVQAHLSYVEQCLGEERLLRQRQQRAERRYQLTSVKP
ncbi:MAG: FadR/GntR family transcriptional regulator [Saccharospirillum sp.]